MRDVSQVDTSVEVFGHNLPIPVGIGKFFFFFSHVILNKNFVIYIDI